MLANWAFRWQSSIFNAWAEVQYLVGDLRSHKLPDRDRKKRKRTSELNPITYEKNHTS